jgi:hypothetical protein
MPDHFAVHDDHAAGADQQVDAPMAVKRRMLGGAPALFMGTR